MHDANVGGVVVLGRSFGILGVAVDDFAVQTVFFMLRVVDGVKGVVYRSQV